MGVRYLDISIRQSMFGDVMEGESE